MKRLKEKMHPAMFWLLAMMLTCLGIVVIWWILPALITTPREKMQQELAKELGVEIQDYPYPFAFPSGYFYIVLKPGMSVAEVHEIVQGYEKVLHCGKNAEVYYYLSAELENAERFWLIYDDQGKYQRFQGEDNDSGILSTAGCVAGLIEE